MSDGCQYDMVPDSGCWARLHQCLNKAIRDGFCGVHHPAAVKRRDKKRQDKYDAQTKEWDEKWERKAFNDRAGNRCRELGIKPEEICEPIKN